MLDQVETGEEERFHGQLLERLHMIVTTRAWLVAALLGRERRAFQLLLGLGDSGYAAATRVY